MPHHRLEAILSEYTATRNLGKFVDSLEQLLRAGEDFFLLRFHLGNAYQMQKRYEKAAVEMEKAVEFDDEVYKPHYKLASIYAQLGEHAKAVEVYAKSIEVDPTQSQAPANMGASLLILERYPEAMRAFERALQIDPSDAVAANGLANARLIAAMPPGERPKVMLAPETGPNFTQIAWSWVSRHIRTLHRGQRRPNEPGARMDTLRPP